ncbi:urea ABC transporter ATP-binding subunit UrtE [Paracoccus seriniphilus]|uniref:Amino acid/amide ABC transporter ATP-binding protein 2, HAAT family n=1 Tax=Paracoccus seriniphilus TaxID=184748 RepID=A0A239PN21_9RHOB|nr:urea ABC transporter ATP-binding subunit UrtE [Paracoccus seriniphilus]WCR13635.1 urea ABC transporter ATP-binding subunit UrtE [Paracoccus seriniphilus]SNT68769.1 amino acid/amide ABC transporter ATP-binding protein 2, HAAT family [Paracoccus seriniphilus]
MLEARKLTLHYGGSQILHGIDIAARPGAVTCVMGNNGVGKTSLMNLLAGRHPRSGGSLRFAGRELGRVTAQGLARMGVGYVPQGRAIFPMLTVRENMETGFACLPRGARVIPDEIFESFPVLAEMAHRRGGDLSGGQQQQLAIARALITKPRVLLLDEPTEGIQPNIIAQIGRVIADLRDRGDMAIVLVEQFFDFAWDLGDEFLVLERGRAVAQGAKAELRREDLHARLAAHAAA